MLSGEPSQPQKDLYEAPLLPGWSEHIGPQGQTYYYNAIGGESTYFRPSATGVEGVPVYSGPPPTQAMHTREGQEIPAPQKEKPKTKEPIPGADGWLKVTTNLGNVFYTNLSSKRSEWTIPKEIQSFVDAMDEKDRRKKVELLEQQRKERQDTMRRVQEQRERERKERLEKEEQSRKASEHEKRKLEKLMLQKKEEDEIVFQDRLRILQEAKKRKREADIPEEGPDTSTHEEKRTRVHTENGLGERANDDEEVLWQWEVADDMAAEAEREEHNPTDTHISDSTSEHLSLEDQKLIFLHMLTSLNGTPNEVNPMAPWDRELPKFADQRDFAVLSQLHDRQDAFNDWCRLRLQEKRQHAAHPKIRRSEEDKEKLAISKVSPPIKTVKADTFEKYRALLEKEVTSTRTRWEDFRKYWKKDRRFFEYGRSDRERERAFRSWLKDLGEKKRKVAEEAEKAFLTLLNEKLDKSALSKDVAASAPPELWNKAKRKAHLEQDSRYDAVGSSSRRFELFSAWIQGDETSTIQNNGDKSDNQKIEKHRDKKQALRDREEQVRRQRKEVESLNKRTLGIAHRDESLTSFRQLLVDAVRDPLASLSVTFKDLSRDERFRVPELNDEEKEDLFFQHVDRLNEKRLRSLEEVFERHAPTLDIEGEVALPLIKDDDEIGRRKLDHLHLIVHEGKSLDTLFHNWQVKREKRAKDAFDAMLRENAFVEFWGRLRQEQKYHKARGGEDATSKSGDDEKKEEEEEEEETDMPTLLQMAASIDLEEIHSILRPKMKGDQRYRSWQHKPQLREEWIRQYLQTMDIPKRTVFQQKK